MKNSLYLSLETRAHATVYTIVTVRYFFLHTTNLTYNYNIRTAYLLSHGCFIN